MQHIRAVTLDLDDTLWAVGPVIERAEVLLWRWLNSNYPGIGERWSSEAIVRLRNNIVADYPDRSHDFRFLRKKTLAHVAVDSGYSAELVDPAFDVFDAARNAVQLYPDVIEVLDWLARHFTVIAVTNGNANLQTIGIDHYFDGIVSSVSVGVAKPAQPIFDEAVRQSGVVSGDILHVGDHPLTDVSGAQRAGLLAAWINRDGATWPDEHPPADVEIADMHELQRLLAGAVPASAT